MNPFTVIFYQPLYNLLFYFIHILPGESMGLGIIALTILIRLALLPLSAQGVRAQRELQFLQPKMDELRAKYKDQPDELNKQIFALYQEHKVNPLGSCLPLLIQLPILIVLYQVFMSGIQADNLNMLYSFVSAPENLNHYLFGIDLRNSNLILAIISGAAQFVQTWQLMRKQPTTNKAVEKTTESSVKDASQQMNKVMMYLMPLFMVYIGTRLPAALALYWTVSTLFQVVQQWWLFRTKPEIATPHISVQVRK